MHAEVYNLERVLDEPQQWVVPVYQRNYEWETGENEQIPTLWDNLQDQARARLNSDPIIPHYLGAIIYSRSQKRPLGTVPECYLVDGQQRLTTSHLVVTAIREIAKKYSIPAISARASQLIFNDVTKLRDPKRAQFKLWSSFYDRELYQLIANHDFDMLSTHKPEYFYKNGKLKRGKKHVPALLRAYHYLVQVMDAFVRDNMVHDGLSSAESLCMALMETFINDFRVVGIELDDEDDAQEIFASLNGLGKPLAPFDLIRNAIFLRARDTHELDHQQLFDQHWKHFENDFWKTEVRQGRSKRARSDHLIAHAVVAETAREINVGKVETEYRRYAEERAFESVVDELRVLKRHADTYTAMQTFNTTSVVSHISNMLHVWDSSVFYPFILAVCATFDGDDVRLQLFDFAENYIVRREICGLSNSGYNKIVPSFIQQLGEGPNAVQTLVDFTSAQKSDTSRMPTDSDLRESFRSRSVYGSIPTPRLRYILLALENESRTRDQESTVVDHELTIEHVMPRHWATHWPLPDGTSAPCESPTEALNRRVALTEEMRSFMDERQRLTNTFGNLTLLTNALNPMLGNAGWKTKREKIGSLSLLKMNRDITSSENWTESSIEKRAQQQAEIANRIWPRDPFGQ